VVDGFCPVPAGRRPVPLGYGRGRMLQWLSKCGLKIGGDGKAASRVLDGWRCICKSRLAVRAESRIGATMVGMPVK